MPFLLRKSSFNRDICHLYVKMKFLMGSQRYIISAQTYKSRPPPINFSSIIFVVCGFIIIIITITPHCVCVCVCGINNIILCVTFGICADKSEGVASQFPISFYTNNFFLSKDLAHELHHENVNDTKQPIP